MDDGCFAGWRVVAGVEGVFLTGRVAGVGKSDDVEIASGTGLVPIRIKLSPIAVEFMYLSIDS